MNFFPTLELAVGRAKPHLCIAAVLFTGGLSAPPLHAQSVVLSADASTLPVAAAPLLVAVEVKVLEAPPNHLPKEFLEVSGTAISAAELDKLLRSVQKDEAVKIASYPRMVTVTMHEVDIRSVVNVPLPNGQPALPIGSIFKILPAFREGLVDLTVDLTATEKIGEDKGFPIVSSRRHSTSVKVPDHTTAVFVLANTAPASATTVARDMVCLITPERISAQSPSETEELAGELILPRVQFTQASFDEAIEFLRAKGRIHGVDETKVINIVVSAEPKQNKLDLDLRDVPFSRALRQVADLAGLDLRYEGNAVVFGTRRSLQSSASPSDPGISSPAVTKARTTILPNIKLNKSTLAEAVDFLRAKSRSLSADGKGLDFLVKDAPAAAKPVITLDLKEVSVLEALRQSATQAGFIIGEDGDVIVLTPLKK